MLIPPIQDPERVWHTSNAASNVSETLRTLTARPRRGMNVVHQSTAELSYHFTHQHRQDIHQNTPHHLTKSPKSPYHLLSQISPYLGQRGRLGWS